MTGHGRVTRRRRIDRDHRIRSLRRASHGASGGAVDHAFATTAEVRRQFARRDAVGAVLAVFQRPLLNRTVDQAQVVDASIFAGGFTSFDEVRDRNRGQETDDCHYDHDFNERETRFA